jgi:hypothetical protein
MATLLVRVSGHGFKGNANCGASIIAKNTN